MIIPTEAVVLRSEDTGEHDERLTLYTREMGKLKAKITGVKKSRSKLRLLTVPFAETRLQIFLAGTPRNAWGRPGKVITGEVLNFRSTLRTDCERMIHSSIFCETLDTLTHHFYPNEREYKLLTATLDQMETTASPLCLRLKSTLTLLNILGYSVRHNDYWLRLPGDDRALLDRLARWSPETHSFTDEESKRMESAAETYLSHYLSGPLKSRLFQKKMSSMRETMYAVT